MYTGGTNTFAHRSPGAGAHTLYGHTKYIQVVLFTLSRHQHWFPPGHQGTSPASPGPGVAWTSLPLCVWASDGDPKGGTTSKETLILA